MKYGLFYGYKNNGNVAGMLGFVIGNGKIDKIIEDIKTLIKNNEDKVNSTKKEVIDFISTHKFFNNDGEFDLYHKFLDFSSEKIKLSKEKEHK